MVALTAATLKPPGTTLKRALGAHIRQRHLNVIGFGADPTGVADSHAAIMAAINWQIANQSRGKIYFPRGTYSISEPIDIDFGDDLGGNMAVGLEGEPGATITGNFNDFLVKYLHDPDADSGSMRGNIDMLKFVNTHATGGGLQYGTCVGGVINDCIFSANRGLWLEIEYSSWIPFEVCVSNCHFDPGVNPTGSMGMRAGANGPIFNCTFTGMATGVEPFGGQGGQVLAGCLFRECGVGIASGAWGIMGCRFVSCGTAINVSPSTWARSFTAGNHIEATEIMVFGNQPQYGIKAVFENQILWTSILGLNVNGQFEGRGVHVGIGAAANNGYTMMAGIGVTNTSTLGGIAWQSPLTTNGQAIGSFLANNNKFVITGVPSGTSGGGLPNAREGDSFNVTNSNTNVWGATYATGAPNHHVKVRYNGTAWTVVGK